MATTQGVKGDVTKEEELQGDKNSFIRKLQVIILSATKIVSSLNVVFFFFFLENLCCCEAESSYNI